MGGDIWVNSEEGKGSTFSFTIAMTNALRPASRSKIAIPEPQLWKDSIRILVVEDNAVNLVTHFYFYDCW